MLRKRITSFKRLLIAERKRKWIINNMKAVLKKP